MATFLASVLLVSSLSASPCPLVEPFPKFYEGSQLSSKDNYFHSIAIHAQSQQLVVGGNGYDRSAQPNTINHNPFTIKYNLATGQMAWGVYYGIEGQYISNMRFNPSGSKIAIHTYSCCGSYKTSVGLISTDGGQLLALKEYVYEKQYQNQDKMTLLDSLDNVYVLNHIQHETTNCCFTQLFKLPLLTASTLTSTFALKSLVSGIPYALTFAENDSSFYEKSYNGSWYHISRHVSDGAGGFSTEWIQGVAGSTYGTAFFETMVLNSTHCLSVFANNAQKTSTGTAKLVLRHLLYNTATHSLEHLLTFNHGPQFVPAIELSLYALEILDLTHAMVALAKNGVGVYMVRYEFWLGQYTSSGVRYEYLSPHIASQTLTQGVMSGEKLYIANTMAAGVLYEGINYLTHKKKLNIIASSDPADYCFPVTIITGQDSANLIRQTLSFTPLTFSDFYQSSPHSVQFIDRSSTSTHPLLYTALTNYTCLCGCTHVIISTTQVQSMYQAMLGVILNVSVGAFEYLWENGGSCHVPYNFTYTAKYANGSSLAEPFSFNSGSMQIEVGSTSVKGTYSIEITGSLVELGQQASVTIDIVVDGNYGAPQYEGGLLHQYVKAGETKVYELPALTDPDGDAFTIIFDLGVASDFVIVTPDLQSVQISPPLSRAKQVVQIVVVLSDSNMITPMSQNTSFLIFIQDPSPPSFLKNCSLEPFPKILASKTLLGSNIYTFASAGSLQTYDFAIGGQTSGKELLNSFPAYQVHTDYPIVTLYEGRHYTRKWVKYFDSPEYQVYSMAFSTLGTSLAVYIESNQFQQSTYKSYISILNSTDGSLVKALMCNEDGIQVVRYFSKLVLDEGLNLVVSARKQLETVGSSGFKRYVVYRVSFATGVTQWSLLSKGGGYAYDVVPGETVDSLFLLNNQPNTTTNRYYLARLSSVQTNNPSIDFLSFTTEGGINSPQLDTYSIKATSTVILAVHYASIRNGTLRTLCLRFRLLNYTNGAIVGEQYYSHELFQSQNGSHYSFNMVKMWGKDKAQTVIGDTATNKVYLVEIEFAMATVKYRVLDPQPNNRQWISAFIYADGQYLLATVSSKPFHTVTANNKYYAAILTNVKENSCHEITDYDKIDLVGALLTYTTPSQLASPSDYYTTSTLAFSTFPVTVSDTNTTDLEVHNTGACQLPSVSMDGSGVFGGVETVEVSVNNAVAPSISYNEFVVSGSISGCMDMTVKYELINADGGIVPNFITASQETKEIVIGSDMLKGVYNLQIKGTLPNGQSELSPILLVNITGNYGPPIFTEAIPNSLAIQPGTSKTLTLPTVTDPDSEDTYSLSIDIPANNFTQYSNGILTFYVSPYESQGSYLIKITLTDNNPYLVLSKEYTINITIPESLKVSRAQNCYYEAFSKFHTCTNGDVVGTAIAVSDEELIVGAQANVGCLGVSGTGKRAYLSTYSLSDGSMNWEKYLTLNTAVFRQIEISDSVAITLVQDQIYTIVFKALLADGALVTYKKLRLDISTIDPNIRSMSLRSPNSILLLGYSYLDKVTICEISLDPSKATVGNQLKISNFNPTPDSLSLHGDRLSLMYHRPSQRYLTLLDLLTFTELWTRQYDVVNTQYCPQLTIQDGLIASGCVTSVANRLVIKIVFLQNDIFVNTTLYLMESQIEQAIPILIEIIGSKKIMMVSSDFQGEWEYCVVEIGSGSARVNRVSNNNLRKNVAYVGIRVMQSEHVVYFMSSFKDLTTIKNDQSTYFIKQGQQSIMLASTVLQNLCTISTISNIEQQSLIYDASSSQISNVLYYTNVISVYTISGLYLLTLGQSPSQNPVSDMCQQESLTISDQNTPKQVLYFKVREITEQIQSFKPFTTNEIDFCGQPTFKYIVASCNGQAYLPQNITLIENFIHVGYQNIKSSLSVQIKGTLPNLQSTITEIQVDIEGNYGPPYFDEELLPQYIEAGQLLVYNLPNIVDPDSEMVKVSINFGQASFGSFDGYDKLTFSPGKNANAMNYNIIITLTDTNKYPLTTNYGLQLTVIKIEAPQPLIDHTLPPTPPPTPPPSTTPQTPPPPPNNSTQQQTSSQEILQEDQLTTQKYGDDEDDTTYDSSLEENNEESGSGYIPIGQIKKNRIINGGKKKQTIQIVDLSAKIASVSQSGVATIKFNEDILVVQNFNILVEKALMVKLITSSENVRLSSWNATTSFSLQDQVYSKIEIALNFSDPIMISQSNIQDKLEITIVGNALFKRASDKRPIKYKYTMIKAIPQQQVDSSAIQSLQVAGTYASGIISFLGYGLLVIQIFMSVSMSLLWGLMNTMQMIVHLKMLNVVMPVNAMMVISFMENLANFKIVKKVTNFIVDNVLKLVPDEEEEDEIGGSEYDGGLVKNLKLVIFGALVLAILICVLGAFMIMRKRVPLIDSLYQTLKAKLFYNGVLRSLLETYLKLSIATFYGMTEIDLSSLDKTTILNSTLTLALLIGIVIGYPLFTYKFLKANQTLLQTDAFLKQFGSLLLNLDIKKTLSSSLMSSLFLLRRLLYAFSICFFGQVPLLQVFIQIFSSLTMLYYLLNIMPYTDTLLNSVEIMNELSLLICSYFLLCFSDFVPSPEIRMSIGWAFAGFLGVNLLANWVILFYRMLQPVIRKVLGRIRRKKGSTAVRKIPREILKEIAIPERQEIDPIEGTQQNPQDRVRTPISERRYQQVEEKKIEYQTIQNSVKKGFKENIRRMKVLQQLLNGDQQ